MSKSPQQEWRARNPEKVRENKRKYYQANKERIALQSKAYVKKPPTSDQLRNRHYKHKYGISLVEYDLMFQNQSGVCSICQGPETAVNRQGEVSSLCVDHCHTTGKVRGLLCRNCNSALGKFKDSLILLERAKDYIKNEGNI